MITITYMDPRSISRAGVVNETSEKDSGQRVSIDNCSIYTYFMRLRFLVAS